jgi:broad specificity phosphatase PhoE
MVLENIKQSLQKKRKAVIIRHAERYSIDNMVNAFEAELTEKGLRDASKFGKDLTDLPGVEKKRNILFYHSPIKRCIQTAETIQKSIENSGYSSKMVGDMFELGGPYIAGDWSDVAGEIEKNEYEVFIRKWFNNEYPSDLVMPLKESAYTITGALLDRLKGEDVFTINVTHDLNVLVLREYFFNIRHEEVGIPGFLDGIVLYVEEGRMHLLYNDLKVSVDLPLLDCQNVCNNPSLLRNC